MHQQLWGYKVEEKLYLGVREQKRLNTDTLIGLCSYKSSIHKASFNITLFQYYYYHHNFFKDGDINEIYVPKILCKFSALMLKK
jgi:hypothetical protein